jgi:hypothetical protein
MKYFFWLVLSFGFATSVHAQAFEIPDFYSFETAEDYESYEQDVLAGINWLLETPINEQTAKRKKTNAFVLKWMTGTPKVTLKIQASVVPFMSTSPDLLLVFMAGWTKHALEQQAYKDARAGTLAGLEAVIAFYTRNKAAMGKDKQVEKFVKMQQKGTLVAFVEKEVAAD